MSRSIFGIWGSELDDDDFASALAALGLVADQLVELPSEERAKFVDECLGDTLVHKEFLVWSVNIPLSSIGEIIKPVSASMLRDAWRKFIQSKSDRRLEIQVSKYITVVLPWVFKELLRSDVGLRGLYVRNEYTSEIRFWNWPLDVGVLSDHDSLVLKEQFEKIYWIDKLVQVQSLNQEDSTCDVLFIPHTPRNALSQLFSMPYKVNTGLVVLLDGMNEPWERTLPLLESIRTQVNACGICVMVIPYQSHTDFFNEFIEGIAHNQPPDIVFTMISRYLEYDFLYFSAATQFIDNTTLTKATLRLTKNLMVLPENQPVLLSDNASNITPNFDFEMEAHELAIKLEEDLDKIEFHHESYGASGIADITKAVKEIKAEDGYVAGPRYIQGKVYHVPSDPLKRVPCEDKFIVGNRYMLDVHIGPPDEDWLKPDPTSVFPVDEIEWKSDYERLQVVFYESYHSPEPQTATIILPKHRASSICQFRFRIKGDKKDFEGRVTVLHRNRVIQTALLTGRVVSEAGEKVDRQLELSIESVIRKNLETLDRRQEYDVAFIANHTAAGEPVLATIADERAYLKSIKNLEQVFKDIPAVLENVVRHPDKYPQDLTKKENAFWLRDLAFKGKYLYDGIVNQEIKPERLKGIERMQLISTVTDYLPLEFIYDRTPPKMDAGLCPRYKEALKNGECTVCEYLNLPAAEYICPLGFWSLKYVIERHSVKKIDIGAADFALQSEPVKGRDKLQLFREILYATASRMDKVQKDGSKRVHDELEDASQHNIVRVYNWDDWAKSIENYDPSLLVLLPHTQKGGDHNLPLMEIGDDSWLYDVYLNKVYVKKSDKAIPILILFGCQTFDWSIPFKNFATQFKQYGAVIVISTLTKILGRHAAPVTETLIKNLVDASKKGLSLGDAMLQTRRNAFREGIPMALTIVAEGDADWQLTGN